MKYLKYIGLIALLLASFVGITFSVMFPPAVSAAEEYDGPANGGYLGFVEYGFSIYKDEGCSVFYVPDDPKESEMELSVVKGAAFNPAENKGSFDCTDDDKLTFRIVANDNSFINHLNFGEGSVFKILEAKSFNDVVDDPKIITERWVPDAFLEGPDITELTISLRPLGVHNGSTDWLMIELLRNPDAPRPDVFYTVTASADGHGSVSPESKKVQIGDDCTFICTADEGYRAYRVEASSDGSYMQSWDVVAYQNTVDFTLKSVDRNIDLTVFFQEDSGDPSPVDPPRPENRTRNIFFTCSEGGSINAPGILTDYPCNIDFSVWCYPEDGYVFGGVVIDGVVVSAVNEYDDVYMFEVPPSATDQSVHVQFIAKGSSSTRIITITSSDGGTTDPAPGIHDVERGVVFPIFFDADSGYAPYFVEVDGERTYVDRELNGWTLPASWSDQSFHVEYARIGADPIDNEQNPDKNNGQNTDGSYIASASDSASVPSITSPLVQSGQNALEGINGTYLVKAGKDDSYTSPKTGWF